MTQSFKAFCHPDHTVPKHIILRAAEKILNVFDIEQQTPGWQVYSKRYVWVHMERVNGIICSGPTPPGDSQFSSPSSSGTRCFLWRKSFLHPDPRCCGNHTLLLQYLSLEDAHGRGVVVGVGLLLLCCFPEGWADSRLLSNHERACLWGGKQLYSSFQKGEPGFVFLICTGKQVLLFLHDRWQSNSTRLIHSLQSIRVWIQKFPMSYFQWTY